MKKQEKQTILEWYRQNQKYIDAPCGGMGNCGKCKVRFEKDAPKPTLREQELLSETEIEAQIRLACMTEMVEEKRFTLVGDIFTEKINAGNENCAQAYGVAIDIGTTTLEMALIDLETCKNTATVSKMNPQRMYGADVLTRIKLANEGHLQELKTCIVRALTELFEELLAGAKVSTSHVHKVAIVGNTTMLHLLRGLSCEGLGRAPFTPVDISLQKYIVSLDKDNAAEGIPVYILPGISTFVGADVVAGIFQLDMDKKDTTQLLVDVGTNGEMVIGDEKGLWVTSVAAGPVFEGGNISCGMPAVAGGVIHLQYKKDAWYYESMNDKEPKGICGTGFIDLLAELFRLELVDENGTLIDAYFDTGYSIVGVDKNGKKKELLRIIQTDIRELQMGKAAIRAGIERLCEVVTPVQIALSGAFGTHIDVENAIRLGMFAKEVGDRIISVGNTALKGAQKFLLDEAGEQRVQKIVTLATEIVLAEEASFYERYIQYMQLEK